MNPAVSPVEPLPAVYRFISENRVEVRTTPMMIPAIARISMDRRTVPKRKIERTVVIAG